MVNNYFLNKACNIEIAGFWQKQPFSEPVFKA